MGYRISWYKADKKEPLTVTEQNDNGYEDIEINGVKILNNSATESFLKLRRNSEFQKEINCLREHPDLDFYSITKKGLKMIILDYRERVIEYTKAAIELFEHPEEKDMKKHIFTQDLLEMVKSELREWEASYTDEKTGDDRYFNIDLSKNKDTFGISGSWYYKYGIYDLIEMYKYFDFENYTLVAYGG